MRVALIGDSHTQALWPLVRSALEDAGHEVVLERAEPGWTAERYGTEGKVQFQLVEAAPDVVLIELGGNNSNFDADYFDHAGWLIDAARRAGAKKILWFGPASSDPSVAPSTAERHDRTAEMQGDHIEVLGVKWFDSRPWTQTGHRSDGVHFTSEGYDAWAAQIVDTFRKHGAGFPLVAWVGLSAGVLGLIAAILYRLRA
jgi:lysophospholipase L1-like esterase